jgi:hypothetical protein
MLVARPLASLAVALVAAAGASAQVVMDQIGPDPTATTGLATYASQQFEPANTNFNIAALDDFNLAAAGTVQRVEAVLGFFNGGSLPAITGYRVEFYSSVAAAAANLTGDQGSVTLAPGAVTVTPNFGVNIGQTPNILVSIPVAGVNLTAGTHWVSVIPIMNFTGGGQVGVSRSMLGASLNAHQANPGGGFAFPGNFSQIDGDAATPGVQGINLAYRVTMVPAPGSLALLGLGGLVATRRRRRA